MFDHFKLLIYLPIFISGLLYFLKIYVTLEYLIFYKLFFNSYSYDLTHSLQVNLAPPRSFSLNTCPTPSSYNNVWKRLSNKNESSDCNCESECKCHCNNKKDDDLFITWTKQIKQRNQSSG